MQGRIGWGNCQGSLLKVSYFKGNFNTKIDILFYLELQKNVLPLIYKAEILLKVTLNPIESIIHCSINDCLSNISIFKTIYWNFALTNILYIILNAKNTLLS